MVNETDCFLLMDFVFCSRHDLGEAFETTGFLREQVAIVGEETLTERNIIVVSVLVNVDSDV